MGQPRVILVTGASRGIGLAMTALLLAQAEARNLTVVGTGRAVFPDLRRFYDSQVAPAQEIIQARKLLPASATSTFESFERLFAAPRFIYYRADLGVPEMDIEGDTEDDHGTVCALIRTILTKHDRLDAVVHNAGVIEPIATIANINLGAMRRNIEVNLFSTIRLAKASIKAMKRNAPDAGGKQGSFLYVSSGASSKVRQGMGAYSMSKAAANMLVAQVAHEEPTIFSLALRPGVVDTAMQEVIGSAGRGVMDESTYASFVGLRGDGKLLHPFVPGSVFAALAALSSGEAAQMCGLSSGSYGSWDDAAVETARGVVFPHE